MKVAADLDSNPKIRRAGRNGREVFLFILRRTNLQERDGRCSLSSVDAWYLADQLMMPEADAAEGVARAVDAGLIAIDDDQVVVCGWDDEWAKRPADGAERTERWRNKRRVQAEKLASPTVTDRHGDESDGSDQIREDQIRSDQIREEDGGAPATALHENGTLRRACVVDRNAHKPALDAFHRYYMASHAGANPTWGAAQVKQIKALTSKHSVEEVIRRIGVLSKTPPAWPRTPWDLATFVQHFDKIATATAPERASFFDVIDSLPASDESPRAVAR